MKYTFKDMYKEDLYDKSKVVFVTGQKNLFVNMVVDKLKSSCNGEVIKFNDNSLADEFKDLFGDDMTIQNVVDFDYFTKTAYIPSVTGKWFCNIELDSMNKKQLDWVSKYIKEPSQYALLCLTSTKYKYYMSWLKNKIVDSSVDVNLIQLSFPDRATLVTVVNQMFNERGAKIEPRAVELFITRLNQEYDEYDKAVDKVIEGCYPLNYLEMDEDDRPIIMYDMALKAMQGIEAYGIDDFLLKLTQPLTSDKVSGRKPIYKMLHYLIDMYGAKDLVTKLKYSIDELIQFRININNGNIPVLVDYNVAEAKEAVGDNPIKDRTDYKFKKLAQLAAKTSIQDWVYMRLIIGNTSIYDKNSYEKVLYSLVTRSVLTESRLNNDIGIDNFTRYDMDYINNIKYVDICKAMETNNGGKEDIGDG